MQTDCPTLAQRFTTGRLPAPEALRYAMMLADSLRKLHEAGRFHGGLTPSHILLKGGGLALLPPDESPLPGPYTPPEVLQGRAADQRSDTFALGAILFEMFTGRRAFEDGNTGTPPPSSGSPTVDKLLRSCLERDPGARYQRLQKLMLELKLLSVAVRRAEAPSPTRVEATSAALRSEMAQVEARLAARLQAHDAAIGAQLDGAAAVRAAMQQLDNRIAAMERAAADREQTGARFEALLENMNARVQNLEQARTADGEWVRKVEATIKEQAAAIDSSRRAIAQTDDLVERVVEALESLQSIVLEPSEPAK